MTWNGPQVSAEMKKEAMDALYKFGEDEILARSRQLVPYDEHILEADSGVTPDESKGMVSVWFGAGPAEAYAVVQHENLSFKHEAGRTAKYLETAVKERAGAMLGKIGDALKKRIGG